MPDITNPGSSIGNININLNEIYDYLNSDEVKHALQTKAGQTMAQLVAPIVGGLHISKAQKQQIMRSLEQNFGPLLGEVIVETALSAVMFALKFIMENIQDLAPRMLGSVDPATNSCSVDTVTYEPSEGEGDNGGGGV